MKRLGSTGRIIVLAGLFGLGASHGAIPSLAAQTGIRLVEAHPDPVEPRFGEPFLLRVKLRLSPDTDLFISDTLLPAPSMAGAGHARWTSAAGPGDSLDIDLEYPAIGFQFGQHELPRGEIFLRDRDPASQTPQVLPVTEARPSVTPDERATIDLGTVAVAHFAAFNGIPSDTILTPRPAAGVLGGEWSLWLLLAIGLASTAAVGGAGAFLPRLWSGRGAALFAKLQGRSPAQESLREMDRVLSLGQHRSGAVDEFYAAITDILRRFVGHLDPEVGPSLTVSEWFGRLEARRGPNRLAPLAKALSTAEQVKFGTYRPDAASAEVDWTAIRDWIRAAG